MSRKYLGWHAYEVCEIKIDNSITLSFPEVNMIYYEPADREVNAVSGWGMQCEPCRLTFNHYLSCTTVKALTSIKKQRTKRLLLHTSYNKLSQYNEISVCINTIAAKHTKNNGLSADMVN